jgi:hypothetical protein
MLPEALRANMIKPGERPVGRAKGTPNALTASIKDAIEKAFTKLGGEDYLVYVGKKDPRTFCALLAKLLPTKIANADGSPILQAISNLSDEELAARTARALAQAQRQGLLDAAQDAPKLIEVSAEVQPVEAKQVISENADNAEREKA